jgi:hypothetical protein
MKKLAYIASLFIWAGSSHAELITWEISAGITELNPDMVGYANIGDVITLRYTFDNTIPDAEPGVIERGKYNNAVTSADIFLNSDHAQLDSVGYITILNDFSAGEDVYLTSSIDTAVINETLPSYGGFGFTGYTFTYKDNDATMFSDTNLTNEPILSGFDSLRLTLHFRNPPSGTVGLGSAILADDLISITQITAVPVPAAFWLFFSGAICILGIAKHKKHT